MAMSESTLSGKFVLIDKWRIYKNTITEFPIFALHPDYPLNPPGTDYVPFSHVGIIWNTHAMAKINQVKSCFVETVHLERWNDYVEENALIQKDLTPELAVQRIEDIGVHLLEVSRSSRIDDAVLAEFQGVAVGVVDLLRNASQAVKCIRTLVEHSAYTYYHSVGVGILAPAIALELGEKREEVLREFALGGLLHDIGKLEISEDIINKPAKLDPAEWEQMRRHPRMGVEKLAAASGVPERVRNMILMHHEKMNGRGYPDSLPAEKIPEEARIATVVDIFNALNTTRCYHKKRNAFESLMLIKHNMQEEVWEPALAALVRVLSKEVESPVERASLKG
jgi:putative nucleotidyltransferase with HDIG domain